MTPDPSGPQPLAPVVLPEPDDDHPNYAEDWGAPSGSPSRLFAILVTASAGLGAIFSAVSTSDFMQFLDRQVHSIHCSFVPGVGKELGESGCRTVMMSPYSSWFRESVWGGVPVSLLALAVFAYLVYRGGALALKGTATRAEAGFLLVATALPVGMSVIYGILSAQVGASCKVCIGMYAASVACFVLAALLLRKVPHDSQGSPGQYLFWFAQGVGFVAVLVLVYFSFRPASDAKVATGCGSLVQPEDPGVMVELKSGGKVDAVEVLDPLCPSCKAFDARLAASSVAKELALKGVLFPLDSTCNWMVTEELHPGACAVSEAVLCAAGFGEKKDHAAARKVLAWAYKHQERLREDAKKDQKAMRAELEEQFPEVKGCLGGPVVKNKLTRSLRWAVANALPVLTPQLFVRDRHVCDEDTDLGLEYTLRRMVSAPAPAKGAGK